MGAALEAVRPKIEQAAIDDPAAFWNAMHPLLKDQMFALCALDEAANDLWGKIQGKRVFELWGLDMSLAPLSDYTIGIDTIEEDGREDAGVRRLARSTRSSSVRMKTSISSAPCASKPTRYSASTPTVAGPRNRRSTIRGRLPNWASNSLSSLCLPRIGTDEKGLRRIGPADRRR